MEPVAVFGYGSLVNAASASITLGRTVERLWPAALGGWRRRFSEKRDNRTCEKTFASIEDGRVPEWILGLNVEPADEGAGPLNGALIEISPAELDRLDIREMRYDRVEVTGSVTSPEGTPSFDRVITYTAKPAHFAPEPPDDAVILRSYARAVEDGFDALGPGEREQYLRTTAPLPVPMIDGELVHDAIPPGNPRAW